MGIKFYLQKHKDRSLKHLLLHPLAHRTEEFWALRHVTVQIRSGEKVGIVGPNGSGKSTLLRLFTCIYDPDEGELAVHGNVTLLALKAGFEDELTGIENVYLKGSLHGLSKKEIDGIRARIIEFAGIGKFINQPLKTYSSGMVARLGFAISIHLNPDILLIDEVLAVGDEEFKRRCYAALDSFMKRNDKIVILVSHNAEMIQRMCTRKITLDHGSLISDDRIQ